ncbi:hypothetical protein G6F42_028904 [Rhizopus arrhizus]|nr:hypothetical protein G6F42_028904 [Rhizopus arrhizus]
MVVSLVSVLTATFLLSGLRTSRNAIVDLAFCGNGARAVEVSNQHYTPGSNILLPGRGQNMGDGWETKRSRTPGHTDHVLIRLGDKDHLEGHQLHSRNP